jgi:hypothetical protein
LDFDWNIHFPAALRLAPELRNDLRRQYADGEEGVAELANWLVGTTWLTLPHQARFDRLVPDLRSLVGLDVDLARTPGLIRNVLIAHTDLRWVTICGLTPQEILSWPHVGVGKAQACLSFALAESLRARLPAGDRSSAANSQEPPSRDARIQQLRREGRTLREIAQEFRSRRSGSGRYLIAREVRRTTRSGAFGCEADRIGRLSWRN